MYKLSIYYIHYTVSNISFHWLCGINSPNNSFMLSPSYKEKNHREKMMLPQRKNDVTLSNSRITSSIIMMYAIQEIMLDHIVS